MRYRITYIEALDLAPEVVEADDLRREGNRHIVLWGTAFVMSQPRAVVVRRLRICDVVAVEEV